MTSHARVSDLLAESRVVRDRLFEGRGVVEVLGRIWGEGAWTAADLEQPCSALVRRGCDNRGRSPEVVAVREEPPSLRPAAPA